MFVYSEHFVEHLSVQDRGRFLTECRRFLNDGVVRIGMPCLHEAVSQYYETIGPASRGSQNTAIRGSIPGPSALMLHLDIGDTNGFTISKNLTDGLGRQDLLIGTVTWGESKFPELKKACDQRRNNAHY